MGNNTSRLDSYTRVQAGLDAHSRTCVTLTTGLIQKASPRVTEVFLDYCDTYNRAVAGYVEMARSSATALVSVPRPAFIEKDRDDEIPEP